MRSWGSPEYYGALLCALIALILIATIKGCASIGAPEGYHYRMTVYVGDRAYSGIRDVTYSSDLSLEGLHRQHRHEVDGEAIPITKPGKPISFALLTSNKLSPEFVALRPIVRGLNPAKEDIDEADIAKVKGEHDLPRRIKHSDISDSPYHRDDVIETWPDFVAFDDPTDPASRRAVTPEELGVRRITIQVTDDAAAKAITAYPALRKALATPN